MTPEKLFAGATDRNREPILAVLRAVLPPSGTVLEIASGTGQHAVHFAPALAPRVWQPSEPDETLRASIAAWAAEQPSDFLRPPLALDVMTWPWPVEAPLSAIVNINMIHISPWDACRALMQGAAELLPGGGVLFLYGPYRTGGQWRSPNDPAFDQSLKQRNPSWGVRDLEDVITEAAANGLVLERTVDMPAGNLSVVFRR
jgi:SAM-dependent methyltransferase